MKPKGTAVELERRRRRAMRLLESGHSLEIVAPMVGGGIQRRVAVARGSTPTWAGGVGAEIGPWPADEVDSAAS